MKIIKGENNFFGLDIGTKSIRAVELKGSGDVKTLLRYGSVEIENNISSSDAVADRQKVGQVIRQLMSATGITTKNVAVGLPAQKVFTTLVDIDRLSDSEIAQSIKLQADTLIPTTLDESKIDWAVVGDSPADPGKVEVLLSSATNDYVESRLDMLESAGLNVIAFEPESIAITRSLLPPGSTGMTMIIDIGERYTDLVVSAGGVPRLIRSIATGSEAIVKSAMQNLNIDQKQAEQFVNKFGISKEKLEGQIYSAIIGTIDILISEVERSIKFVSSRYPNTSIEKIIVSGGAATIPEFPLYVANKFGVAVEIGNAWRNISFPPEMQNDLLAVSNHFAVAVGLAGRKE